MKICSNCKLPKKLSDFNKDIHHIDKLRSECKVCFSKNKKQYYKTNKDILLNKMKKYYENHRNTIQHQQNIYTKTQTKIDKIFKIQRNLRSRLNDAIHEIERKDQQLKILVVLFQNSRSILNLNSILICHGLIGEKSGN